MRYIFSEPPFDSTAENVHAIYNYLTCDLYKLPTSVLYDAFLCKFTTRIDALYKQ